MKAHKLCYLPVAFNVDKVRFTSKNLSVVHSVWNCVLNETKIVYYYFSKYRLWVELIGQNEQLQRQTVFNFIVKFRQQQREAQEIVWLPKIYVGYMPFI